MVDFESCDKCKHSSKSGYAFPCGVCIHNAVERFEPKTNDDRINDMSPEEKAEWLFEHDSITAEKGRLSKEELLEWLKSEVRE